MAIPDVEKMVSLVRDRKILSEASFKNADLYEALRLRDLEAGYRCYHSDDLRKRWREAQVATEVDKAVESLWNTALRISTDCTSRYLHTDQDDDRKELSHYIARELTEIAMDVVTNAGFEWYDLLWSRYEVDQIPMIHATPIIRPILEKRFG